MIRLFHGNQIAQYRREANAMFTARAHVFRERLGWDVEVVDGWEVDEFDRANPLYAVQFDPLTQDIGGSVRLLPTTGPNMLAAKFADSFDEPIDISSPTIWECTRFCIHPSPAGERVAREAMRITHEINLAVCELGLYAGIEQIQAVYDDAMVKVYRKIGWNPEPMARSSKLGSRPVYVGLWTIDQTSLDALRKISGISESVIEPEGLRLLQKVA